MEVDLWKDKKSFGKHFLGAVFKAALVAAVFFFVSCGSMEKGVTVFERDYIRSLDIERQIKVDTTVDGAHVFDVSKIPAYDIGDKFYIYNETPGEIYVAVYYRSDALEKWRWAGAQFIESMDRESIDALEEHIPETPLYCVRVKGDRGTDYQMSVSADNHDLCIHIGESF